MTIQIFPVFENFAARATGIDLRQIPSAVQIEQIHAAMNQYGVLVFDGQDLDDDQQMQFATQLGPIEDEAAVVDAQLQRLKHRQMIDISNLEVNGSIMAANDRRRMFNLGNRLWHSDSSFKTIPALYSMLHARVVPPEGGETQFADMRWAWDRLPAAMQAHIEPMICDHSLIYSRALLGFDEFTPAEKLAFAPVAQRLVRRHAGSLRKSIFLSSHIGQVHGMLRPEAMSLIRELIEQACAPEYVYSHTWHAHDLVIWDNRCTMHRGRPYDDIRFKRDMRRITLADSESTLAQTVGC